MVPAVFDRWLGARWRRSSSEHRLIVRGMASVMLFVLAAKVSGAVKEMVVAWRYGVGAEVDAYLFVLNLVNWPVVIWFSVLSVIVIPMDARVRAESPQELPRFRAELLGVTLLVGVVLFAVGRVLLPGLVTSEWIRLPARTSALAARMIPGLVWVTPLGLLVGLYSTWTMSSGRHLNTLLEGVPALGILVAVLLTGGIEPLIWGTVGGTLVQLSLLAVPVSVREAHAPPSFKLSSPHWAPFWQGFGVMVLSQAIISMTILVDQFFAARLGEGSISTLGYANRLLALVLSLGATAVTRATLPVFSASRAAGATTVAHLARRWSTLMALVGLVGLLAGWVLAPYAVRLLFQRGTFTAEDTVNVTRLLRFGLLQLPVYFASLVFVSLHSADGRYLLLLASAVLSLSMKAIAIFLLLPTFAVGALMLSSAVVYASSTALLALARRR